MNMRAVCRDMQLVRARRRTHCWASFSVLLWALLSSRAAAAGLTEINGLTEPCRTIAVATAESGIVIEVAVRTITVFIPHPPFSRLLK